MAEDLPSISDMKTACQELQIRLTRPFQHGEELDEQFSKIKSSLEQIISNPSNDGHLILFLKGLATHLREQLRRELTWGVRLLTILADATRDIPFWREQFGLQERVTVHAPIQVEHDCILDVALSVIAGPDIPSYKSVQPVRDALRIIANCCANNNINRALIIRGGGIFYMMKLLSHSTEVDHSIATLYNVCTDFDEPATNVSDTTLALNTDMTENAQSDQRLSLTAAEQLLGRWQGDPLNYTTIEYLLFVHEKCCTDYLPVLGELLDMASRPANFGLDNVFAPGENNERSYEDFLETFGTWTLRLVDRHTEGSIYVSQVLSNLFSQTGLRKSMLKREPYLYLRRFFFTFPYENLSDIDEDDSERLDRTRTSLLRHLYEIADMPEFMNSISSTSEMVKSVIEELHNHATALDQNPPQFPDVVPPQLLASKLVVLASIARDEKNAIRLCEMTGIYELLVMFLSHHIDVRVTSPALSLAISLTQSPEGTSGLYEARILEAIQKLLHVPQTSFEIQKEVVKLTRIIIKSDMDRANDIVEHGLLKTLLQLSDNTLDGSTKIEVARLVIELCRVMDKASKAGKRRGSLHDLYSRRVNGPVVELENQITLLITEAHSAKSSNDVAQGFFALALLGSQPARRSRFLNALTQSKMLGVLEDVAATRGTPQYKNLEAILRIVKQDGSMPILDLPEGTQGRLTSIMEKMGL